MCLPSTHCFGNNKLCSCYRRPPQLLSDVGSELSFQLPLGASPSFPELFSRLEAESKTLGVETYGISVTTLEEVFMKVLVLPRGYFSYSECELLYRCGYAPPGGSCRHRRWCGAELCVCVLPLLSPRLPRLAQPRSSRSSGSCHASCPTPAKSALALTAPVLTWLPRPSTPPNPRQTTGATWPWKALRSSWCGRCRLFRATFHGSVCD